MSRRIAYAALGLMALASQAASQPTGGWIEPNPNKPPEVFQAEQDQCRAYAEHSLRYAPQPPSQGSAVGGALAGLVVGANLGAAVGHRTGALIGAGAGAIAGAELGANAGQRGATEGSEARYQGVYRQCLRNFGNLGPGDEAPPPPPPPPPPGWSQPR